MTKDQIPDLLFRLLVVVIVAIPASVLFWALRQPPTPLSIMAGLCALLLLIPLFLVIPLRWLPPPTSALMLQKRFGLGGMTRPQGKIAYEWTPISEIPSDLLLAIILIEDTNFPLHFGFDLDSLRKAHQYNKDHEHKLGGSTITQQLAKNLFLWPDASYVRKFIEAYFTVLMEAFWSKQRILEIYVNIIRLDFEIFGVGAAARHLLGKEPSALTRQECALIATVIASPLRYRITEPNHYVRYRQTMVLARMKSVGHDYLALLKE